MNILKFYWRFALEERATSIKANAERRGKKVQDVSAKFFG
jgi:hypothetical protein